MRDGKNDLHVRNSNVGSRVWGELLTHGLTYITWLYVAAFGAYSLRSYCVSCEVTSVKKAIPAFFILQLLSATARLKVDPDGSGTDALTLFSSYGVSVLNIAGAAVVFADMLRCFLQQVRPA